MKNDKFKPGDKVKILNLLINDNRYDVEGIVIKKHNRGEHEGKYLVNYRYIFLNIEEERLVKINE